MANVTVMIPPPLRQFAQNQTALTVEADTLGHAFEVLRQSHGNLVDRITTDTQEIRPFVNVFIDRVNSRALKGMSTPLTDGQQIIIMTAFAGG
jgi:molybdopterin synthase sulfur carrier subunit